MANAEMCSFVVIYTVIIQGPLDPYFAQISENPVKIQERL